MHTVSAFDIHHECFPISVLKLSLHGFYWNAVCVRIRHICTMNVCLVHMQHARSSVYLLKMYGINMN